MIKTLSACAIVLALSTGAMAERGGRSEQNKDRESRSGQERGDQKWDKIAEKLELDSATATQLKAIITRQMEARKAVAANLKTEMASLKTLVDNKAGDAAINSALNKIEALRRQMHDGGASSEIRTLLGPTKAAQLTLMQDKMMSNMRENIRGSMRGGSNRGNRNRNND